MSDKFCYSILNCFCLGCILKNVCYIFDGLASLIGSPLKGSIHFLFASSSINYLLVEVYLHKNSKRSKF